MKIALHNELPAPAQFQQLLKSVSDTEFAADANAYAAYSQSPHVIAAYDQEQLVALGRLVTEGGQDEKLEFAVLPMYRGREIEDNMRKLLKIRALKA